MERKHSILTAFLLFWFLPDMINGFTSLEITEFVIDASLRICVVILMIELYLSVNFTRIYLKYALLLSLIGAIYEIFNYSIISLFIFHPLLDTMVLILRLIGFCLGFAAFMQLVLSYQYSGERITRANKPKEVKTPWRTKGWFKLWKA